MKRRLLTCCGSAGDSRRKESPRRITALGLIAALAAIPAAALDPEKAFHQYRLDVWQPEGTEGGGLLRLKDPRLTPVTTRDGLPHERLTTVYEDRDGILWIGSDGGGLFRLEDGQFTAYSTRQGLPARHRSRSA